MTDREVMLHRFARKNLRKSTGTLCWELGLTRQEYEAACERAMKQESDERRKRQFEEAINKLEQFAANRNN